MIYETGVFLPSKEQKKALKGVADSSFSAGLPRDFGAMPIPDGWTLCGDTGVSLRLKCVEPHTDPYVGSDKEPRKYLCVFWLVEQRSNPYPGLVHLQVANDYKRLHEGSYVIFDDTKVHSVVAESYWRGVAYQIKPTKKAKQRWVKK